MLTEIPVWLSRLERLRPYSRRTCVPCVGNVNSFSPRRPRHRGRLIGDVGAYVPYVLHLIRSILDQALLRLLSTDGEIIFQYV